MPKLTFKVLHEFVKAARLNLNQTHWDYLIGGTETETTLRRNRQAIEQRALMPRVLNDVSEVSTSCTLLGCPLAMPVLLAPIGSLQVLDDAGGAGAALAAGEAGIMSFASSVCEPNLETIAGASGAAKVYQLYVRGDETWVDDIIRRVIASGYQGLCLTVDTAVLSRRERDIAKRVIPTSQASAGDFTFQAKLAWADVDRIKRDFDLPLILKGIDHPDDAKRALDHGVEAIYVSNHGGRQLDHGLGTLDLLSDIKTVVGDQAELIIDGGFYRGSDILKALALGANAVGLGRLQGWALAAGGPDALVSCLNILRLELIEALALCGLSDVGDVHPDLVRPATPVSDASIFSAFPLLSFDEGY